MSATTHLAQYNVSIEQAQQFIFANLSQPARIVEVCQQFGVTNAMLAEIYGQGVDAQAVISFFASQGIDSSGLDATSSPDDEQPQWLQDFTGSVEHGSSDGYHDGYLQGFIDYLYEQMAEQMDTPEFQDTSISIPYNPDGADTAEYQAGYSNSYSQGYQAGSSKSDYNSIYVGEALAFAPTSQLTLSDLDLVGASDGYLTGYMAGLHALVSGGEAQTYQQEYFNSELAEAEYTEAYSQAFHEGLADGYALDGYEASIYAVGQLEQSVADLFL